MIWYNDIKQNKKSPKSNLFFKYYLSFESERHCFQNVFSIDWKAYQVDKKSSQVKYRLQNVTVRQYKKFGCCRYDLI